MSIFRPKKYLLSALAILAASFLARAVNLAYNSPFNDEAIYIVIGKMGLFGGDWTSYNAASWMAGLPFLYPSLAGAGFELGGIVGARMANVVFGMLSVVLIFFITLHFSDLKGKGKLKSALIASALVGGTSVGYYVSRLATYDIPSFFFLLASLFLLLLAQKSKNPAKTYFFAFVALSIGVGIKIIVGIFIPLFVVFSYLAARESRKLFLFWRAYFLIPLSFTLLIYLALNFGNLTSYYQTQTLARVSFDEILGVFRENLGGIWIFYLVGSLGMLVKGQWRVWAILSLAAFWILFFHLAIGHPLSLDKHTFLSVAFLSIASGLGIANLLPTVSPQKRPLFLAGDAVVAIILFWFFSYQDAQKYNLLWKNTDTPLAYLASEVKSEDKILSELGASTMLALYEKDFPTNVTTFDWLEYKKHSGLPAYKGAVSDGYFNYIVLESEDVPKLESFERVHEIVIESTEENYSIIYDKDGFSVLKRNF